MLDVRAGQNSALEVVSCYSFSHDGGRPAVALPDTRLLALTLLHSPA